MDARTALKQLFGQEPYPYQERVAQTLLAGKNVILRAPTGAGKTEAALGPFLLARQQGNKDFPLRCIIASPMRTLAKDLFERAKTAASKLDPPLTVKLHTGEDPADPLLEADIIVTTVDQLLSNYLHVPYSQSWRSRNIGAGSVVASYVVLDEFHLYDPARAFRTALEMARALQGITPFLFMTATMSEHLTEKLAKAVEAEFITPDAAELVTMQSQQKKRSIRRVEATLTAEAVAQAHRRRSIAIANTVDRVQTLYADLKRLQKAGHPNLQGVTMVMLHSRYFPIHRNAHEIRLKELLGRKSTHNVILVASQAVEVGIDISSEQLHTELCPANALLQRAGRNARYAGETGVVSVYDLPRDEAGEWETLPYALKPRKDGKDTAENLERVKVLSDTWAALLGLNDPVTPADEARLIDAVHISGDKATWHAYETTRTSTFRDKMNTAFNGERSLRPDLIRDIQNVSLLMVKPETDLSTWAEVNRHERLSVTWVNFAALEENRRMRDLEHDFEQNWLCKIPIELDQESKTETWQPTRLTWKTVTNRCELKGQPLVLINPEFVYYTCAEGFRWQAPENSELGVHPDDIPPAHETRPTGESSDYWYVYETYQEHIERVLEASEKHARDVWHICPKVDEQHGLPAGTTALALRAAIAAHDIGKLSTGWQNWTRGWQAWQVQEYGTQALWDGKSVVKAQGKGDYCAHTDYHPTFDRDRNKDFDRQHGRRPPHAGESAAVLAQTFDHHLCDLLGDEKGLEVLRGILGAVARHHSAASKGETGAWKLDDGAAQEAARVFAELAGVPLDDAQLKHLQKRGVDALTEPEMPKPAEDLSWLIYTLASRALRLGDTRSFEDVRQQEKEVQT